MKFDTILFDIDGVLIKTIDSFHATDIATAEYVAGTIYGLDWGQREGKKLFTFEDVAAFKQSGGYNNDWDMCYLLATLGTARLREWKGTSLAERSSQEWAALSRAANLEGSVGIRGRGGIEGSGGIGGRGAIEWVRKVMPATAQLPYDVIGDIYHEYYWGASEYAKWFGLAPRYLPDFPGFVHNEEMLYPPDFFARLRKMGIRHMGMITGRVGPEVSSALERMEAYSGERWWDVVIPADICAKPDPRAIQLAIEGTMSGGPVTLSGRQGTMSGGPGMGTRAADATCHPERSEGSQLVAGLYTGDATCHPERSEGSQLVAGLYIGDTGDDLDLVLNYRTVKKAHEPDMLAVMLVHEDEAALYMQRGADFIVGSVTDITAYLPD